MFDDPEVNADAYERDAAGNGGATPASAGNAAAGCDVAAVTEDEDEDAMHDADRGRGADRLRVCDSGCVAVETPDIEC